MKVYMKEYGNKKDGMNYDSFSMARKEEKIKYEGLSVASEGE